LVGADDLQVSSAEDLNWILLGLVADRIIAGGEQAQAPLCNVTKNLRAAMDTTESVARRVVPVSRLIRNQNGPISEDGVP
jgi:hypothetical protein